MTDTETVDNLAPAIDTLDTLKGHSSWVLQCKGLQALQRIATALEASHGPDPFAGLFDALAGQEESDTGTPDDTEGDEVELPGVPDFKVFVERDASAPLGMRLYLIGPGGVAYPLTWQERG